MVKVGEHTASLTPRQRVIAVVKVVLPAPIGARRAMRRLSPMAARNSAATRSISLSFSIFSCIVF